MWPHAPEVSPPAGVQPLLRVQTHLLKMAYSLCLRSSILCFYFIYLLVFFGPCVAFKFALLHLFELR